MFQATGAASPAPAHVRGVCILGFVWEFQLGLGSQGAGLYTEAVFLTWHFKAQPQLLKEQSWGQECSSRRCCLLSTLDTSLRLCSIHSSWSCCLFVCVSMAFPDHN